MIIERRKADRNFIVLIIFISTHLGGSIWWASKITTKQEYLAEIITELKREIKEKDGNYVKRTEYEIQIKEINVKAANTETRIANLEKDVSNLPPQWFKDDYNNFKKRFEKLEMRGKSN